MAFRERIAWIRLVTTLGLWGLYAVVALFTLAAGGGDGRWPVALFVECAIVSLVIQFGLTAIAGLRAPGAWRSPADERERDIAGVAARRANLLLIGGVLGVAILSALAIGVGLPVGSYRLVPVGVWDPMAVMANGLLLAVVLSEALKSATVVILHRRAT